MAFPNLTFKHSHTDEGRHLEGVVGDKFDALQKYISDPESARCEVEFEKAAPKNSGDVYRVEANMWVSGKLYRAEATLATFEKAIDEVRNELDKEMRRAHKKRESLFRRGSRKIKDMMRWGQ